MCLWCTIYIKLENDKVSLQEHNCQYLPDIIWALILGREHLGDAAHYENLAPRTCDAGTFR
jgi:hypothetical protein